MVQKKNQKTSKNKRKYIYEKTTKTLDICHENKMNEFYKNYNSLSKLKKDLTIVKRELNELQNANDIDEDTNNNSESYYDMLYDLETKEKELITKIKSIESGEDELEYLENTSDILCQYFDMIDEHPSNTNTSTSSSTSSLPIKDLRDFFYPQSKSRSNSNINVHDSDIDYRTEESIYTMNLDELIEKNKKDTSENYDRSDLLEIYLSKTDSDYIDNNINKDMDITICKFCNSHDLCEYQNEGIIYCNQCHTIENIISDNDKPSYKEPPKEISYFSYNRMNHFSEWINQTQGKETTEIPQEVFDKIYMELKKDRISNMANITHDKIKSILKKHRNENMNKYYEHIPYILNRITGKTNPHLSPELEEKLRNMFRDIQGPFRRHMPKERKNFLSYSYVLHKFLEILGEDKYIPYFPLLKSRDKLKQQQIIWEKICEDLGWPFIRSI